MTATLLPTAVFAAESTPTSGLCGAGDDIVFWNYDGEGTLTITGSGEMQDYKHEYFENVAPWYSFESEITTVIVGDKITRIGEEAFGSGPYWSGYNNITSVTIGPDVEKIGAYAFEGTQIAEITLPDSLVTIGPGAFDSTNLKEITIPSSVEQMDNFYYCYDLEAINVERGNDNYYSDDGVLYQKLENGTYALMTYPADKRDDSYSVINGTTEIAEFAFEGSEYLRNVTVPSGVKEIPELAFYGCRNLEEVNLPQGMTSVSSIAFASCLALQEVHIPASVIDFTSEYTPAEWSEPRMLPLSVYFYGDTAPGFDAGIASTQDLSSYVTIYYPIDATGWDAVQQQDNIQWALESGCLRFAAWNPNGSDVTLTRNMFTVDTSNEVYDGTAKTKTVTSNLAEGTDYTVSYSNNLNAGTATLTITGMGLYSGTLSYSFTIERADRPLTAAALPELYVGGAAAQVQITDSIPASENPTYTYASSDPAVAAVDGQGVVTPVGEGTAVITVAAPATANYQEGSAVVNVTVSALPGQEVSFAQTGDQTATYGDAGFTNAASNATQGGGAITYASSNTDVAVVDENGAVTIVGAGETTISATAAGVDGQYAPTTVAYKLTVAPKEITASAQVAGKTFDGTTEANVTVTFSGTVDGDDVDGYTVTAAFADPNAGSGKEVNVSISITDPNYTLSNPTLALTDGVILKAGARQIDDQDLPVRYDDTAEKTFDLSLLMPANAGELSYALPEATGDATYMVQEDAFVYRLAEGLTQNDVKNITVPVTITSQNYEDSTVNMVVRITDKYVPVLAPSDVTVTYDGAPVEDSAITGTAAVNGSAVAGSWSFQAGQAITNVKDSGNKIVVFVPDDLNAYETVKDTVLVTIHKADPTGEPSYTAITSSGHILADANLSQGTIQPTGAIAWDDPAGTSVRANTAYGWTFTPDDADNYNLLTGTITPYKRSSGGGGSSSGGHDSQNQQTGETDEEIEEPVSNFSDVSSSAWYSEAVDYVYENGLMTGVSSTQFAPNNTLTRAMVVQTLYAMAGKPSVSAASSFADVSSGDWYAQAVAWASANGVVSGYNAAQFAPNDPVTREQMALILYLYAQMMGYDAARAGVDLRAFVDYDEISSWALEAMDWAVNAGLLTGTGNDVLDPTGTATRAEVAQILMNFCENIQK